ncbi:MAG: class I tRNA ligase family protein [Candidatus Taylorbacteria bacterium]|nr:class I tRNA ligase family protein [Candidatus Taylorbacteria bacterium]
MKSYNHRKIEKKWQQYWERKKLNLATADPKKKKFYDLIEFPFLSGEGLHVGHIRSYTAMDIIARKRRAEGQNVLYPIGWDAFGLPTENFAIKTGKSPESITRELTNNFRRQLKALGFSFDWSREVATSDPDYYKWTQWIFLKFFEKGLAYKKKMAINWCPKDKIGLANEEVVDGACERCGTPVEKRDKDQWMLTITKYADRLDRDLEAVDFLEKIKIQQRNWIGRSEGVEIGFRLQGLGFSEEIKVFTTRPDTLFGATYLVIAPEHEFVRKLMQNQESRIKNQDEVVRYIVLSKKKSEIERTAEGKEKTGVKLEGVSAVNPANQENIPIFVADYVLADYGTGAIMAVPAHDERDFEFAKKYKLQIRNVVAQLFVRNEGKDAWHSDEPEATRQAVACLVKHWQENKYLFLNKKGLSDSDERVVVAVSGGIDSKENPMTAGIREIVEETGYQKVKFVKALGSPIAFRYFALNGNQNRLTFLYPLYFQLTGSDQVSVSKREKILHDLVWVKEEEIKKYLEGGRGFNSVFWQRLKGEDVAYTGNGLLVNSGQFNGLGSADAKKKITEFVGGKIMTTYKLRDWVFSRQRYWGEPIPLIFCDACRKLVENYKSQITNSKQITNHKFSNGELMNPGWVPVLEKDLPVKLPKVKNYKPTDTGESPLANVSKWVNVKCPHCGGAARRETDTMPNWAGSSWYYIAYCISENLKSQAPISKQFPSPNIQKKIKHWLPVDWYNGGMEHTTLHLLYSRFWHKFLFDFGLVPTSEPYAKRTSHGLILAEGGAKMSKSKGNIVNPDEIVKRFGADTLRLYEMFMGPFDQHIAWSTESMIGPRRFLERVWKLGERITNQESRIKNPESKIVNHESLLHKTVKKVGEDIEALRFNTAVSALMILLNDFEKMPAVSKNHYEIFLRLLAPFAPHITEELWSFSNKTSIHLEPWPSYNPALTERGTGTLVIQVNGKVRANLPIDGELSAEEAKTRALELREIKKWVSDGTIKKVVYVPGRLINLVV